MKTFKFRYVDADAPSFSYTTSTATTPQNISNDATGLGSKSSPIILDRQDLGQLQITQNTSGVTGDFSVADDSSSQFEINSNGSVLTKVGTDKILPGTVVHIDYSYTENGNKKTKSIYFKYGKDLTYKSNSESTPVTIDMNSTNTIQDKPKQIELSPTDDLRYGSWSTSEPGLTINGQTGVLSGLDKLKLGQTFKIVYTGAPADTFTITFKYGDANKDIKLNNPNQATYEYVHGQQGVDLTKLFGVTDPTDAKYYYNDGKKQVELTNDGLKKLAVSNTPYQVTIKKDGYNDKVVNLLVTNKSTTVINNNGSSNSGSTATSTGTSTTPVTTPSTNTGSTATTTNTNGSNTVTTNSGQTVTIGNNIGVEGEAVYAIGPIYLYKNATFKKSQRMAYYPKQKRTNRPMFVVVGYEKVNGKLRYEVKDVNHTKNTANKTGYITANTKYVVPVYYSSVPKSKTITVIAKGGVNSYSSKNLSGKSKHYKKGAHLKVKVIIKHNLTTRYQLTNGKYITANKKLVIQGRY